MPVDLTLPEIRLELVEDLSPAGQTGFLKLLRHRYRAHYPDGSVSEPFVYDIVDRSALDAVVIVAHFARDAARRVYLRSALRPPLARRHLGRTPPEVPHTGGLWELPAGLVEVSERGAESAARAAQRELLEELGFDVPLEALHPLGPDVFPAPGFIAERHYFFEVEVAPHARGEPDLDGSPLERAGRVVDVPLEQALSLCASGTIDDSKTELGLRRLAERFA